MTKEPDITVRTVDVDALYVEERLGLVRLAFLLTGSLRRPRMWCRTRSSGVCHDSMASTSPAPTCVPRW